MPHQCTNCDRTFPDGSKEMLSGCPDCGGNKFQFAPASATAGDASSGGAAEASRSDATGSNGGSAVEDGGSGSRATKAVRSWVSDVAESVTGESATDDSGSASFAEWPDTARPPADRSAAAADSDDSSASTDGTPRSSTSSPTAADPAALEGSEDTAQADARTEVVSPDELPTTERTPAPTGSSELTGSPESSDENRSAEPSPSRPNAEPAGDAESTVEADAGAESARATTAGPDADAVDYGDRPEHGRVVSEPTGDRPSLDELREELNDQFESIKIVRPGEYELNLMELYDREEYIVSLQEDGRYVIDVPDSWRDGDE